MTGAAETLPPLPAPPPEADAPAAPRAKTRTIKANFLINVAGAIVPLAVSLVTVPIYIRHIGDARYGVLSIVWVLLGYFGFLDLGLSRAAANALARLRDAPQEARARVLVTTLVLNLGMGLIGSLALALAGSYLLQHVLNVPDALKPEIASAFPWIVALFPLALVSGVGIGALESREEFLRANALGVIGTSLGQIVPVALALLISPSLSLVIPAAVVARGFTAAALIAMAWRFEGPLRLAHFDLRQGASLMRYGGWISLSAVIEPVLNSMDQFAIGVTLGAAQVAHYAVPMNLVLRSQIFSVALSRTLFPRMSSAQPDEAKATAIRALRAIMYGYATVCSPSIMVAPIFFNLWIGGDFGHSIGTVAQLLFIGAWVNCLAFAPFQLLQSQGRPDAVAKIHALQTLPFLGLLWLLTWRYGILGAAVARIVRSVLDALLLIRAAEIPARPFFDAIIPLTIMVLSAAGSQFLNDDTWKIALATMGLLLLTCLLALACVNDLRAGAQATLARCLSAYAGPKSKLGVSAEVPK